MSIQDLTASLDLKQNLNIYATCKQGDSLNLILTIYDNSVQADLTGYTVRLKAMKSDDVPLIQEHIGITKLNNVVTIVADEQLTTTSGKTLIELQFINKTTSLKKATFNLVLNVVASTLEVNATISKSTYTLLDELENKLDQAGDFLENIDEAIKLNQELITQNTNATSNVSSLTTQNNNATQNISDLEIQNSNASTNIPNLTSLNTQAEANVEAMENFGDVTQLTQNVTALKTEVENARNGEVSLDARLDKNDALVASHTASLSEKVNKTSIVNNLTATVPGSVLDATQGKTLQDEITILQDRNYITTSVQNTVVDVGVGSIANVKFDTVTNAFVDINSMGNITFKQTGIYLVLAKMSVWDMKAGNVIAFNFGEDGTTRYILSTPVDIPSIYGKLDMQKTFVVTTVGTQTSIYAENKSTIMKSIHLSNITVIKLK